MTHFCMQIVNNNRVSFIDPLVRQSHGFIVYMDDTQTRLELHFHFDYPDHVPSDKQLLADKLIYLARLSVPGAVLMMNFKPTEVYLTTKSQQGLIWGEHQNMPPTWVM